MGVRRIVAGILTVYFICTCQCANKYSEEANVRSVDPPPDTLRTLSKPYRMAKLNMLWAKAQIRLTEPKLKSLFGELKIHDKEEIMWKRLRSEGKDKDGMQEATLRKRLIGIMSSYDLLEHFEDVQDTRKHKIHEAFNEATDSKVLKTLFQDKKLNKLWLKAEHAGFTAEELQALKEEFDHHQDKIDQYYAVLADVDKGKQDDHENSIDENLDRFNQLDVDEENTPDKNYLDKSNLLRDKHRDLRDGYDRLHRIAAKGPNSKEFIEPRVQSLWRVAVESSFTHDELESLRVELLHYERRLQKLRAMQVEAALDEDRYKNKQRMAGQKPEAMSMMEENIKKQANKLTKLHDYFEERINMKHMEL